MRLFRVMDFVEENAPTTAAAGASAAAGGIAMSPSLPMTASSGTPPGMYKNVTLNWSWMYCVWPGCKNQHIMCFVANRCGASMIMPRPCLSYIIVYAFCRYRLQ